MSNDTCAAVDCNRTCPPKGRSGPRPMYCSIACRRRTHYATSKTNGSYERALVANRKPLTDRPCAYCGQDFTAKRDDARFCSGTCSNNYRHIDNARQCSVEGCERGYCANGLCKMHYKRVARAEGREKNPAWSDARRARSEIRRALKRGAPITESIDRNAVFERDAWVCGLCASPVDRGLQYPHPMSASLDHVVPLSRGGSHIPENVQCSHLTCNLSKGARVAA